MVQRAPVDVVEIGAAGAQREERGSAGNAILLEGTGVLATPPGPCTGQEISQQEFQTLVRRGLCHTCGARRHEQLQKRLH